MYVPTAFFTTTRRFRWPLRARSAATILAVLALLLGGGINAVAASAATAAPAQDAPTELRLVFGGRSADDDRFVLYTADVDGSDLQRMDPGHPVFHPDVEPGGSRIVYGDGTAVRILDEDGTSRVVYELSLIHI